MKVAGIVKNSVQFVKALHGDDICFFLTGSLKFHLLVRINPVTNVLYMVFERNYVLVTPT